MLMDSGEYYLDGMTHEEAESIHCQRSTEAVLGTERYGQHNRHDHPRPGRSTVSETYCAYCGWAATGIITIYEISNVVSVPAPIFYGLILYIDMIRSDVHDLMKDIADLCG